MINSETIYFLEILSVYWSKYTLHKNLLCWFVCSLPLSLCNCVPNIVLALNLLDNFYVPLLFHRSVFPAGSACPRAAKRIHHQVSTTKRSSPPPEMHPLKLLRPPKFYHNNSHLFSKILSQNHGKS